MTFPSRWTCALVALLAAQAGVLTACGSVEQASPASESAFTTITGPGSQNVEALEFTNDGGYVVGGTFQGDTRIAGVDLAASENGDLFIAKMVSNRQDVEWVATARAQFGIDLGGIAVLDDGSIMLTGSIGGQGVFGSLAVSNIAQDWDGFIAKLDSAGNWVWVQNAGGPGYDTGTDITATTDGDVIVVGMFTLDATFGGTKLRSTGDGYDAYVAKIDGSGTWRWVLAGGGTGRDGAVSVSGTDDGGAYVAGGFDADTVIGTTSLTRVDGMTDAFVAKVSTDGTWSWATAFSGHNYDFATATVASGDGGVIVALRVEDTVRYGNTGYAGSMRFAKIDRSGLVVWRTESVDSDSNKVLDLVRHEDGYVGSGWFSDELALGDETRTALDRRDMMLVSISDAGELSWRGSFGGFYDDEATQIGVDRNGALLVAGAHQNAVVIDGSVVRSTDETGDVVIFPCCTR